MKKLTTEEFIIKAKIKHGDRYDYSLVEYINNSTKIYILCKEHGIFEQKPNNHLNGQKCFGCDGSKKKTTEEFIYKSKLVHGEKYDYSKVIYNGNKKYVEIICNTHGTFKQEPSSHLSGRGCSKCSNTKFKNIFIKRSNIIYDYKYDYSKVKYKNNRTKVSIICPNHGHFEKRPDVHLEGQGCQKCAQSKGETEVMKLLENKNIKYESQKKFENCKYIKSLPFDFYLSDYNMCIEFDGKQHYIINEFFGGEEEFKKLQIRDKIKNDYCKNNNINLLRIKYDENIEEKLNNFLKEKGII